MIVSTCDHARVQKNGKTPKGATRYRCCLCGKSWTDETSALDGMRIALDKAAQIVELLCEGNSASATARITNTNIHTVIDTMNVIGQRCQEFMQREIKGVCADDIQCDEIWQFVLCKRATAKPQKYVGGCGDSYCFTAVERTTKLLVAWHFGKRTERATDIFMQWLLAAVAGRFHLSTDGWQAYPMAAWQHVGGRADYGMLVKIFREGGAEDRRKFSPSEIVGSKKQRIFGVPDGKRICTSHAERMNGTIRAFCKRMGRLTYAFSKRWDNHRNALAVMFAHYNWCRKHKSLKWMSPAMAHGLTDRVWSVRELLEKVTQVPYN